REEAAAAAGAAAAAREEAERARRGMAVRQRLAGGLKELLAAAQEAAALADEAVVAAAAAGVDPRRLLTNQRTLDAMVARVLREWPQAWLPGFRGFVACAVPANADATVLRVSVMDVHSASLSVWFAQPGAAGAASIPAAGAATAVAAPNAAANAAVPDWLEQDLHDCVASAASR
ncbi:MAG: hypothetical protein ACK4KW_15225, partial [Gemmobacter sp.]